MVRRRGPGRRCARVVLVVRVRDRRGRCRRRRRRALSLFGDLCWQNMISWALVEGWFWVSVFFEGHGASVSQTVQAPV